MVEIWYNASMKHARDLLILSFASQQDWEAWLQEHHSETAEIWIKIAKKGTGIASVSHQEAVEGALCYGWIDGQRGSFDEEYFLQKFTPRRPRSLWSQVNCEKATTLIAQGRMQPAGLRQVEEAQADGRWERAYEGQSKATVPEDFQSELEKHPEAKEFFLTLDRANRYAILLRIQTAKQANTRSARIQKCIEMLERKEKLSPPG
jgi:uncharacterized protein YdeI (YjbR/CyaY-like superfamily)